MITLSKSTVESILHWIIIIVCIRQSPGLLQDLHILKYQPQFFPTTSQSLEPPYTVSSLPNRNEHSHALNYNPNPYNFKPIIM